MRQPLSYYNDIDRHALACVRNNIRDGRFPPGVIDSNNVKKVKIEHVQAQGFTQFHFFCGGGGWAQALKLAEWPHDELVWTASLPCQPFSVAGKGQAQADARNLWPWFFGLVRRGRPEHLMGEQVASPDGLAWLDRVFDDLERIGYTCWACDLPAACVGAPQRRQRLFWVARADDRAGRAREPRAKARSGGLGDLDGWCGPVDSALAGPGRERVRVQRGAVGGAQEEDGREAPERKRGRGDDGSDGEHDPPLAGADGGRRRGRSRATGRGPVVGVAAARPSESDPWDAAQLVVCDEPRADGTIERCVRRVAAAPWPFPLAAGHAGLVLVEPADGRPAFWTNRRAALRVIGNMIVAPVAAEFIRDYMDSTNIGR